MRRRARALAVAGLVVVMAIGVSLLILHDQRSANGPVDRHGQLVVVPAGGNKLTLVHFWASWCAPCRSELPGLIKFAVSGRVTLQCVALDAGWPEVDAFLARERIALETSIDPDRSVATHFGVDRMPTTLVFNEHGAMVDRIEGAVDWEDPRTQRRVLGFSEVSHGNGR